MVGFALSMLRLSWAASLYGAERLARFAASPDPRRLSKEGARSVDALTRATSKEMGEALKLAFQAGDDVGREWLGHLATALAPPLRPSALARPLAEVTADSLRAALPGPEALAAWKELANKAEVYRWVKGVHKTLELPPVGEPFSLPEAVERAYRLDPYQSLWAVEGAGHDHAAGFWRRTDRPREVLTARELDGLPEESLLMLHAGMGLAFAEHLMGEVGPASPRSELRHALARFIALCQDNAREGYADAALESLGLMVRCFYPDLTRPVDRELRALDDETLLGYYWHGVGRAIYFLPIQFLPGYGSVRHAVRMAEREAPHELAREKSLVGLGWAFTLVNLNEPRILEAVLRHHGEEIRGGAFAEGLVGSVVMRHDTTPGAPFIPRFFRHRPSSREPRLVELWEEIVRRPLERALGELYPGAEGGEAA